MRGFLAVTAATLLLIAIGVGILATSGPVSWTIRCSSLTSCLQTVRESGIDTPIRLPADHNLSFVAGVFYLGDDVSPWTTPGHESWGMRLEFRQQSTNRRLDWTMKSWPAPLPACPIDAVETPLLLATGIRGCYLPDIFGVWFWSQQMLYSADPDATYGVTHQAPLAYRDFLIAEVNSTVRVAGPN